jgi:hypothetical protein
VLQKVLDRSWTKTGLLRSSNGRFFCLPVFKSPKTEDYAKK